MSAWRAGIRKAHVRCAGSGGNAMSLLNRMLQDLDARQVDGRTIARLHDDVRPLPHVEASLWPKIAAAAVFVGAIAGAVFYAYQPLGQKAELASQPVAAMAAAQSQSATPVVLDAESASAAVPANAAGAEAVPSSESSKSQARAERLDGASLRLSDALFMPVNKKVPTKAASAAASPTEAKTPVVDASLGKIASSAPKLAETPQAPIPEAPRVGKHATIEKTDSVGLPHERAENEYRKAIAAINQGRVAEAVDSLQGALRQEGGHVPARQLLVKLLLEARRTEDAMQVLRDGLQVVPTQSGWAMALARLQVERGDLSGASQTLERSLPAGGTSADYQGFAGHVAYRLGRHREAADHYQVAARLAPGDGRWWLGLGLACDAEGRVGEAREALLRAKASGTLSAELLAVAEQKLR